jgi:hypothetical protein
MTLSQSTLGAVKVKQDPVKWSVLDQRTQRVVSNIAKWLVVDGLPPEVVNKPGFRAFFESVVPEFPHTTSPTVFARVKEFHTGFVDWWLEFQASLEWQALTTDGWTDDSQKHYRTLTAHFFVPGTVDLVSLVLRTGLCGGMDHDIADFILETMREFKIDNKRVSAITSDNANGEQAGIRLVGLLRGSCGCHLLNLTLRLVLFPASLLQLVSL